MPAPAATAAGRCRPPRPAGTLPLFAAAWEPVLILTSFCATHTIVTFSSTQLKASRRVGTGPMSSGLLFCPTCGNLLLGASDTAPSP